MKQILFSIIFFSCCIFSYGQNKSEISLGGGYSNTFKKDNGGYNAWVQFKHGLSKKISIASEFEHIEYEQPNIYAVNPGTNPTQKVSDNNASVVIGYNYFKNSKFQLSIATGLTYYVKLIEYYSTYTFPGVVGEISQRNVVGGSFFGMPVMADGYCSLSNKISIGARFKYNINPNNGSTYSSSVGVSFKL